MKLFSQIIPKKIPFSTLIILSIIVLAGFLRVYRLSVVPPELYGDELDAGYQAYSLLKTGKDIGGNFLPLYAQSLAEFKAPLLFYSMVPFVEIFGLSVWGVRLTAAFWGVLGVVVIYLLTKKLFNNFNIAFTASLLLTISPWHLQFSRGGFEVILLTFLLITGVWAFLKGLEKPVFLIVASILFALTPYTYPTATVFMPLFVFSIIIIFQELLKKKWSMATTKIAVLVFILVLLPFTWQVFFGRASDRFSQISVAVNPEIAKNINSARQLDNGFIGSLFHNKLLSFFHETSRNYFWSFSPQFLFTDGDPVGRHSVGQMGELYWFMLLPLLVGVFVLLTDSNIKKKNKYLLFCWLLLAPIPASLTYTGAGHAIRLILLLPPLIIISAIGTSRIFEKFFKSKIKTTIAVILLILSVFNITSYFHRYYVHYPVESWRWWQIGYREAFSYIKEHQDEYDTIVINNTYEPSLIRFLFYMQYDPKIFRQQFTIDQSQKGILPGIDGFKLDKFYFGTLSVENKGANRLAEVLTPKMLYLASQRDEIVGDLDLGIDAPKEIRVLKTITNPLGDPIFYLVTK